MPILFEGNAGRVIRLDDPAVTCRAALLDVGGKNDPDAQITYDEQASIITRMTVSERVNAQFLHTFGRHVYIYVFGDRIGEITLSGLAFACPCDASGGPDPGAQRMLEWYRLNKASRRQQPVSVSIGSSAIAGFVMGFTEDVADPASMLIQWGVNLVTLPEV